MLFCHEYVLSQLHLSVALSKILLDVIYTISLLPFFLTPGPSPFTCLLPSLSFLLVAQSGNTCFCNAGKQRNLVANEYCSAVVRLQKKNSFYFIPIQGYLQVEKKTI